MIIEFFTLLAIIAGVILFIKIFGKLLKLTSYFLTIAVLTLLIVSFVKPDIKDVFVNQIKENVIDNSAVLQNKITGATTDKEIANEKFINSSSKQT